MEECRQQVAQSQGTKARLEVQRVLLKEKLDQLGCREPPSALELEPVANNVRCLWQPAAACVLSVAASVYLGEPSARLEEEICPHEEEDVPRRSINTLDVLNWQQS